MRCYRPLVCIIITVVIIPIYISVFKFCWSVNNFIFIYLLTNDQIGGDINTQGSGLISSGQSGYLVITPFKLADRE